MNREDLLKEMKDSVGTKDPIVFFQKMTDAFSLLFESLDSLEVQVKKAQLNSVLAIDWDVEAAQDLISKEVSYLRKNGKQTDGTNIFTDEIAALQQEAMIREEMNEGYKSFCAWWKDLLGYHPFLESRK